jgi:hypothetical protein
MLLTTLPAISTTLKVKKQKLAMLSFGLLVQLATGCAVTEPRPWTVTYLEEVVVVEYWSLEQ